MKTALCLATALLALSLFLGTARAEGDKVNWLSLDQAKAKAAAEKRPLLLYFHLPYCYRCKEMKQWVFGDAKVAALLNRDFWPAKINLDQAKDLAAKYRVEDVPSFLFQDTRGGEITRAKGVIRTGDYLKLLRRARAAWQRAGGK